MDYPNYSKKLIQQGFCRIERDDRLLDVFPAQTRAKGIELWEKISNDTTSIIRIKLPYNPKQTKEYTIPRQELESALTNNITLTLPLPSTQAK